MKIRRHFFLLCILTTILTACGSAEPELRLHLPQFEGIDSALLRPIFEQQSGVLIVDSRLDSQQSGLQALVSGDADLALVENSSPFQTGVRALFPVYKSVMHMQVRNDIESFDAIQQPRIHVINGSPAGLSLVKMATSRQKLSSEKLNIVDHLTPGETDIIIYFGPINPRNPSWYVPGYRLLSLNDVDVSSAMSSLAIGYMLPHIEPATIPAKTYDLPGNEDDIHTLAVDTLLATRKAVPQTTVYKLTKTLLEQKPRFAAVAPELFSTLTEDFDPLQLSFPLHAGSRRYLARDEPSTLERYAETINLLVYLLFILLTGGFALARLHSQKKKDRIDKFYSRVLLIRKRAALEVHAPLLVELRQIEEEAFDSLIAEKLAADDSFRILVELLTRTMSELDDIAPDGATARN